MTQHQTALLALMIMSGIGFVLFTTGILVSVFTNRKYKKCTATVMGKVIGYSFRGGGRASPLIEFCIGRKRYVCRKKYAGIIKAYDTRRGKPDAWEDEKGYLHINTGISVNMRELAETLWPTGSDEIVRYDPDNPDNNYTGIFVNNSILRNIFLISGTGTAALGMLMYFLISRT